MNTINNCLDLTAQQNNIWNTEMFYSGSNMHNIGGYIAIDSVVDFNLLEKAANIYIEKTDSVRFHFILKEGTAYQYLSNYKPFKIDLLLLKDFEDVSSVTTEMVNTPFQIVDCNLFKFKMFKFPDGKGGIIPVFHHLINDAWGLGIFISEIMNIYSSLLQGNQENFEFPSYTNYIASSKEYLESNKFIKDQEYWNSVFDTEPEVTFISKNRASNDCNGAREVCNIDACLYNEIQSYCINRHFSVYSFFMSIFSLYISKINNTDSSIIGTPVLNRSNFIEKQTCGMFVSTVPFKINIDYSDDFDSFVQKVVLNQTAIFRHQKYPYLKLLQDIKNKYDVHSNLYDFVLSYQNIRDNKKSCDVPYVSTWFPTSNVAQSLEAHFYDMDDTGNPSIYYNYQTSKFSKEDICNIHNRIISMAKIALKNPKLKDIPVITEEENAFIENFNDTFFEYDKSQSLVDAFEEKAKKLKDQTAVIFQGQSMTYEELNEKSNKLANLLISKGIKRNDVVGIMLDRSFDVIISMWGVLKSGAAYMLIDPTLPNDRVLYMLTNAKSPLVITNLFLNYNNLSLNEADSFDTSLPDVKSQSDDRFCVIYTSGSTGTPKGVVLKRLSIINMVKSYKKILNTDECNMFLSTSTVAFDMFIVETFVSLLSGKTLVLANEDEQKIPAFTSKLIIENNIDFILSTPSKISLLLNESDCLKNVKVIQLGGEVFKPNLYTSLRSLTSARIYNGYGPSECTACSSSKLITDSNNITIGSPFLNVKLYVKNRFGDVMPIGVPGELVVVGDNVGLGYINKYDFNGVYNTGDIAELSKNSELIYYGRKDNQIKLHGLRIELDEITNKIMQQNYIADAVTIIKKVNNIDCICSFVISTDKNISDKELKNKISSSLPKYMIPSHIIFMDKFPMTLNGKIDTKNLPDIIVKEEVYIAPATESEKYLSKAWKSILNIDKISANSNFFDLGGDSLCSIRLVSQIYTDYNIKIEIKDIFDYPILSDLAKYIDDLRDNPKDTVEIEPNVSNKQVSNIKHHAKNEYYPVTPMQRGIYYTASMDSNSLSYNTPFGILFDKIPDTKKLENALLTIINRHDAFKTSFTMHNNDLVQKVSEHIDFKLPVLDHKNEDFVKPFDLSCAPLVHCELDIFDNKALLQIDIHHIVCDGTSISVFIDELCKLYNGISLEKINFDYIDYSVSQNISEEDKKYWISQFQNRIPLLNMPTEFERTSEKSQVGESIYEELDNFEQINMICKKLNVTPYIFLLSAYYILLYKYSMQNEIIVGTPTVGRFEHEFSDTVGMFVNTLALKQNIQSNNSYSEFIKLVRSNCLNAFSHQFYPFEELVKNLSIPRNNSRSPLFDVMFIYQSQGIPNLSFKDINANYLVPENHTSKFDFSLEVTPLDSSFKVRLEYASSLYGKDFMRTFLDCFKNIVNCIIDDPDVQLSKIKMLSNIPELYPTLDYPKDLRIIDLFEKQVLLTPNKIALVFGDESYTYRELNDKVNRLANTIRNTQTFKDSISNSSHKVIGIMMNRRAELLISMLAVLKSGAGYLPIDPTYPEDRIDYIISDSGISLVLTQDDFKDRFKIPYILVDTPQCYGTYESFDTNQSPDDIAYMIYTSGSTGKPKGVMLKQSSVVNFIYAMCDRMPLKDKTIVSVTTMCFDIFVLESLLPVCTGMKVVMASNEEQNNPILLNNLCLKNNVEVIQTTPSKFKFLMSDCIEYIKKMKVISLAGEPFSIDLLKSIKLVTKSRIFNMYGPTETTVGSTLKELTYCDGPVTIGTPIANTQILVLDNDMNPVPYNVPGTLYIGGDGVSIGYINKQELTSERYIDYNGSRVYNSGDLVKLLPNGELMCLGRADFQVKVHGLRIELGEIEQLISSYSGVSDSVVTVKKVNGRDLLCGYFVASGRISISALKNHLSKKLPNYMVPAYLLQLNTFSYTPNGKIDRKVLPDPIFEAKEIVAPQNDIERKLLLIWKSVLSIDEISIYDNFFDIGGDSLFALKLQLELIKSGINVNYGDIFKNNTIHSLALFISNINMDTDVPVYTKKDFKKVDKFLKKNTTFKRIRLKQCPMKNVLLVGATGFLGIHVLAELLKNDDITIYCLIRKDPSTSPENKLKNKFKYYFGSDLSYLFGKRLFVVAGDISIDNFGMADDQYKLLADSVYSVVNCAALVKHYGNYKDFEKINYIGLKNLVYFCEKFDKKLIQTSTISVSGNTMMALPSSYNPNKKVFFGENKLFIKQSLNNVYVRSKFEAEKFMLEELANGKLRGIILRIGNITNRYSDGKFQENSSENAFLNRLKAFMSLKMIPESLLENYVEFSPVDKVAEAIVTCMKYYTYPISVLHLYNSNHLYIDKLIKFLNELGLNINVVDDLTFEKTLKEWLFNSSKYDKVSVLLNDLNDKNSLVYRTNLNITNKFTLKFLSIADFNWPIIDKDYLEKVIKNL